MDPIASIAPPRGFAEIDAFRADRADRAFKDFEAMFVQVLLKEMRATVPDEGGIFPRNAAMDAFEEMLDAAYAQTIAESGQLGIARQLAEEMARNEASMAYSAEKKSLQRQGLEALKAQPGSADKP